MADNTFASTVEALFKGMDSFISTKTVVGEAIKVDEETIILPLVDVSFGVGAGAYTDEDRKKNNGGGGMGGKMTPSSILVIKNGEAKVIQVKNQDPVSKAMDYIPELINKFKKNKDSKKSAEDLDMEDFEADFSDVE